MLFNLLLLTWLYITDISLSINDKNDINFIQFMPQLNKINNLSGISNPNQLKNTIYIPSLYNLCIVFVNDKYFILGQLNKIIPTKK